MHTQCCSSKHLVYLWYAFYMECTLVSDPLSAIVIKICSPCKVLKTFVTNFEVNLSDINYITNDIFDMLQLEFSPDSDAKS